MTSFKGWWNAEAGTTDAVRFKRRLEARGISYEAVKEKLFDSTKSFHERLRWRPGIKGENDLLAVLGLGREEAREIVGDFLESMGEKERFWDYAGLAGSPEEKCPLKLVRRALEVISKTASIFSVQFLWDWLSLDPKLEKRDPWECRINFPSTMGPHNWSLTLPCSLERMLTLKVMDAIKAINRKAGRA